MAVSAPRHHPRPRPAEPPPLDDPVALHRAFRHHRGKRLARIEQRREVRQAGRRFWILLGALLVLAVFLSVTIWEQLQAMFGI